MLECLMRELGIDWLAPTINFYLHRPIVNNDYSTCTCMIIIRTNSIVLLQLLYMAEQLVSGSYPNIYSFQKKCEKVTF